jgi:O-antigen/teichoic acid export membrane protein
MSKARIINIASLFLNSILVKGFVFIVNILMAKYTSVDVYGRFVLVRSAINVAESSLSSSINPLILIDSAKDKEKLAYDAAYYICYGLTGVIVSSGLLVFLYMNSLITISASFGDLSNFFIVPFFIIFSFFNNALLSVNIGKEKFYPILVSSVSAFLVMGIIIYLCRFNLDVYIAIFLLGIYHFLEFLLKLVMNRNTLKPIYCREKIVIEVKNLLLRAKPLIMSGVFNASAFFMIRYLLSVSTDGYKKLAIFDIYFQMIILIMIVTITLVNLVSTMLIKKNLRECTFMVFFKKMTTYILPIIIVASIFTFFITGYLINLINPELYFKSMELYIPLIAISFAISLIQNRSIIVFNLQRVMPKSIFISSAITIIYAYFFAEQPEHLAVSYIIFYLTSIILNSWFCFFLGKSNRKLLNN